jgi:hypothetical protein
MTPMYAGILWAGRPAARSCRPGTPSLSTPGSAGGGGDTAGQPKYKGTSVIKHSVCQPNNLPIETLSFLMSISD